MGIQISAAIMENNMEIPSKTKSEPILRPSYSTSRNISKGMKPTYENDSCTLKLTAAQFTVTELVNQPVDSCVQQLMTG